MLDSTVTYSGTVSSPKLWYTKEIRRNYLVYGLSVATYRMASDSCTIPYNTTPRKRTRHKLPFFHSQTAKIPIMFRVEQCYGFINLNYFLCKTHIFLYIFNKFWNKSLYWLSVLQSTRPGNQIAITGRSKSSKLQKILGAHQASYRRGNQEMFSVLFGW